MTEDGTDYVATKYRDDQGVVIEMKLDCSTAERKACEKDAFRSFVQERLAIAEQVTCDQDYPSGLHTYADTDAFVSQLLKEIDVSPNGVVQPFID